MLVDVGFQDWVKVLKLDVADKGDYKHLVVNKWEKQNPGLV